MNGATEHFASFFRAFYTQFSSTDLDDTKAAALDLIWMFSEKLCEILKADHNSDVLAQNLKQLASEFKTDYRRETERSLHSLGTASQENHDFLVLLFVMYQNFFEDTLKLLTRIVECSRRNRQDEAVLKHYFTEWRMQFIESLLRLKVD